MTSSFTTNYYLRFDFKDILLSQTYNHLCNFIKFLLIFNNFLA